MTAASDFKTLNPERYQKVQKFGRIEIRDKLRHRVGSDHPPGRDDRT